MDLTTSIKFEDIQQQHDQKKYQKFNYIVTINEKSKCGLDGLPEYMEEWALTCFTK